MKPIILASSSPRRRELLEHLHIPFEIMVANIDETPVEGLTPGQQVERLAALKAQTVARRVDRGLVIGADTIVVKEGRLLGKPRDAAAARQMLTWLQGQVHQVYSGLAVIDAASGKKVLTHQCTEVQFKPMSGTEIDRYIATGEPMDKAGAYAVQGLGAVFIEGIRGCYFNVVGLPVGQLAEALKEFGVLVI